MKKTLFKATLLLCLGISSTNVSALSDEFISSGEDLSFLADMNNDFALDEFEYALRKFVLYRKLEEFFFDLNDEYPGIGN